MLPPSSIPTCSGRESRRRSTSRKLDATAIRLELRARQAETLEAQATWASLQTDAALTASMAHEHEELAALADARLARFEELFERRMVTRALLDEVRQDAAMAHMTLTRLRAELADHPNRTASRASKPPLPAPR